MFNGLERQEDKREDVLLLVVRGKRNESPRDNRVTDSDSLSYSMPTFPFNVLDPSRVAYVPTSNLTTQGYGQ